MASNNADDEITLTLVNAQTGESESIPFPRSASLSQVVELSQAVFNLASVRLQKDGQPLSDSSLSLAEAGIANGDMIAVVQTSSASSASGRFDAGGAASASAAPRAAPAGGLDFSSLLAGSSSAPTAGSAVPRDPVYYNGMNLQEATYYNVNPDTFVSGADPVVNGGTFLIV
jgi:hypothetical protein